MRPPRASRPGGDNHRGFPSHVHLFEFDEPAPLSSLEKLRWRALDRSAADGQWRAVRAAPGPLKVTARYNTVDLLGGITRVGEYYTMIRVGGQKVRVQVDVRARLPFHSHLLAPRST